MSEEKANKREEAYTEQIKFLNAKLQQAEARADFAEKSVQKLQKEVIKYWNIGFPFMDIHRGLQILILTINIVL